MADQEKSLPDIVAVLRYALGDALSPDATGFLNLCSEDVVLEFPFAPPDTPTHVRVRDDLATYLEHLGDVIQLRWMSFPIVHITNEAGTVIVEFTADAVSRINERHLTQSYIAVIRTSGGRITHYRDYWNPLVGIAAMEAADV